MADIISLQELADAKLDAQSLEQFINGGVDEEVLTRLSQQYPTIKKLLLEFQKYNGRAYKTYAEMDADKANLSPKTKVTVTNDSTESNNGDWQWDGVAFTKSAYDPLSQTKPFIDVLSNTNQKQATTFYHAPSNLIEKESNEALFAVSIKVQAGQKYVINTKSFGVVGGYYIADTIGNVLQTLASDKIEEQDYVITIPANGAMLYVNCLNTYGNFKLYLLNNEINNLKFAGLGVSNFQFYSNDNGIVSYAHSDFFSKSIDVSSGEFYLIRTSTYDVTPRYLIADSSNQLISSLIQGNFDKDLIIRIPDNAAKLYVNCAYTLRNDFKVEKVSDALALSLNKGHFVLDYTFFYAPNNIIKKNTNDGLFALDMDVQAGQKYSINTKTFGVAGEYYVTDSAGNILQFKAADNVGDEYIITIPVSGAKLYVNCGYDYLVNFNVERLSNALLDIIPAFDPSVRNVFPTVNYFDKLKAKCPNFYQKFKEKTQDVTVVLTGTSLTQGNLYASDRTDASTRPAALHTRDLASSVFDKLIKHWDGQKYRRYDHTDLVYSNSAWPVVNNLSGNVWDDYEHIKNGLTKTTTDANASVSMTIPADAWQFNFVYRSDSQSGNCTVSIAEGNGKVELYNGSEWIEANGATFSMLESPATATKGNTQYQKRLKMRCKNKASGGISSIGSTKQITISKGNNANRFNVVGFEWSPREFMLSVINGARGGFEWGDPNGNRLDQYQDTDIWSFNPDLLLAEITIINWGASEPSSLSKDPLHYVNIAKRAYFNEFNDMPTSLYAKSEAYTKCDVIFYSDTPAATSAVSGAWDSTTHEPKFGTVSVAATNGSIVDTSNVGRVKTNFENYEAVESYIASKDYLFIPVLSTFKSVTEGFYGSYWAGMQPSDKSGNTLSYDGVHFNDNGAALFSKLIASVFDGI
ncbi:hypothetical protein [Acinetobacter johnsonii]|uniref:hypothetical protein n=1 Tax=Acinetobacter johnsonii TaxID=40214 RepID=UPI0032B3BEF2